MRPARVVLKVAISTFIVYQLFAVLLLPISGSLPGRKLARFFTPYANELGMNTTWNFFSPGPSPMFFLQYEVEMSDGSEANNGEPLIYPPPREGRTFSDGWSRRFYGMRYLALDSERYVSFLVPFLCRQTPGAAAIYVQGVLEKIEDIEKADTWAEYPDMTERMSLQRERHSCLPESEPAL